MNEKKRPNTYIIGSFNGYEGHIPVATFENLAGDRNAEITPAETGDATLSLDITDASAERTPPAETEA